MPPAKKDVSVILFDLKTASRDKAVQALLKISGSHAFSSSKALTKLILVNSDVTENRLAARHGGYEHINEICKDTILHNPQMFLEMVENSGTGNANWLEAVHVGVRNLVDEYDSVAGIVTYQLIFITDLTSSLMKTDKKIVDKIVRDIAQLEAFFYVIGPDIEPPYIIKRKQDIEAWMKSLLVDDSNQNLSTLKNLIAKIKNSVACSYEIGCNLVFAHKKFPGGQPWQVPLGIGTSIQLPTQTLKILDDILQCKITRGSFGEMIWVDAEDESVEISPADVITGISRHQKFVQMPENQMFKVETTRSFNVLCFTDSANVPEYLMNGEGCYSVLANSTSERNEAFNILVDTLAQQNKYVIARRVYNNNNLPKIVCLVPKPNHQPKCFYFTSLPFADDVKVNIKEKNVKIAPRGETCDEVYSYLDGLVVDGDKPSLKIPLGINMMQNVNVQRIVNKAIDKCLDKHMDLQNIDLDYLSEAEIPAANSLKTIWIERQLNQPKEEQDKDDGDNSDNDFDW